MKLTADYHTHTVYSDGKNTFLENFRRAKELGLTEIGCTEHGFSHVFRGLKRRELPQYISELRAAEHETGIRALLGLESNIRGESGLCDLNEYDFSDFELFVVGIHVFVNFEKMTDSRLGLGSWFRSQMHIRPSASLVRQTTRAYINAIEKNPVDIISHLNYCCFADPVEVAKCCRDYGTYLEISSKKAHLSDDELAKVADTGVRFVINSDAHSIDRIGDVVRAEEQVTRVGIPPERIDNIDGKMPTFRLAAWRKEHL